MAYMGIDPELQELLEDLRNGYGDPVAEETPSAAEERRRDWELRTGYARKPQSSRSTS